jgi:predicted O-methyltransferase YrrM
LKQLVKQMLPGRVWNGLWRVKNAVATPARVQKYMDMAGYTVAERGDYYSPMSSVPELRSTFNRWNRPSALVGISYDLEGMKARFAELLAGYLQEFLAIPPYEEIRKLGYGPGYTAVDGLTLYMMIRATKPARYMEVGSGVSTYYCSLAAARNRSEGHPITITCIEPNPYAKLFAIPGIQVIAKPVQDVPLEQFAALQSNDVLFIDSSHVLKIDGDVPFLYLEVLPRVNVGTRIHLHDVPFPYNIPYPPALWVFGRPWPMLWNEAMVVQAFLCANRDFQIELSTPLIRHFDEKFLQERIPFYETIEQNPNTFSSLWLTRVR